MFISPRRIMWPTDFSSLSLRGARYARGFRDMFRSELHVVHVIPPPLTPDVAVSLPTEVPVTYSDDEMIEGCRTRLAELIAEQFGGVEGVVSDVFFGNPWSAICKYAAQAEIDLIVVSTHGRHGLQHVVIGSTAERIVQHSPCPVLVVKDSEKDFLRE
jgi:universal stress protein A